jgi:adenosylmethionine-8-amino-7-oxononanoate aminotransferase
MFTFPRDLARTYPTIVRGEGIYLYDDEGNEYLDAGSGAVSVISVGHGREEVAEAMAEQARQVAYVFSGDFHHLPGEELSRRVAEMAPGDLGRAVWVSGGSEAMETALKLARNYHVVRGRTDKRVIVSRYRSYHGATLMTLGVSDVPSRKAIYAPYLTESEKAPAPYSYRIGERMPDGRELYGDPEAVERAIREVGPEQVSCFVAEPIVAAAGPGITPPDGYYQAVREICDRYDVLFIADEIVTGFGRTGRNFGVDHWDTVPDMLVVAKGVSGGYAPLAGVIATERIADVFESSGQSFVHGFTYQAHPVSCAAGLAVLDIIDREGLVENAAVVGEYLFERLRAIQADYPIIGDVRGKGLLAGVELVADPSSRRPYAPGTGARLHALCKRHGIMFYPGAPADGIAGDALLVTPPLIIGRDDVDEIERRFRTALDEFDPDVE